MMNTAYWNKIGSGYNEEIFDVYAEDREGKLKRYLKKHSNKNHFAIDFGCGTGKALPYLAPVFKKVLGLDISEELIRQARELPYDNTEFKRMDLAKPGKLPAADFAFCCNVAILPDEQKNKGILKNIYSGLKAGGAALVVVPSVESTLFAGKRIVEVYAREGKAFNQIPKSELAYYDITKKELLQGFFKISGVPTKHYSEPELRAVFEEAGLTIKKIDRLEYNWTTEFTSPPKWLAAPYPWDWIVECEKVK
jgi:SAM-dependent methyltransferase